MEKVVESVIQSKRWLGRVLFQFYFFAFPYFTVSFIELRKKIHWKVDWLLHWKVDDIFFTIILQHFYSTDFSISEGQTTHPSQTELNVIDNNITVGADKSAFLRCKVENSSDIPVRCVKMFIFNLDRKSRQWIVSLGSLA